MNTQLPVLLKNAIEQGNTDNILESIVAAIESSTVRVSRKDFLALKHGNLSAAQNILKKLNICSCVSIFEENNLAQSEYEACTKAVDSAMKLGSLVKTAQPVWSDQSKYEMNPTVFYKCISCGLIWQLSKPERNHEGIWKTA